MTHTLVVWFIHRFTGLLLCGSLTQLFVAKVVVPDGDDPLNREVEVAVPEWYLLPAMHGPQLRVASKDAPFRFVTPAELADALLRPAFKEMGINLSKLGTKTMAARQGAIKYLTEQHTGVVEQSTSASYRPDTLLIAMFAPSGIAHVVDMAMSHVRTILKQPHSQFL